MLRPGSRWGFVLVAVATWAVTFASVGSAQSSIPNGVFVRNSEGLVWLVLDGQRVKIPVWGASDDEIAAVPVADRWAVMNDAGAIVAGDAPAWLSTSPAPQPAQAAAPAPTATTPPTPAASAGETIKLSGRGRTATESITPPSGAVSASFRHNGKSNFVVRVIRDRPDLLINQIGAYRGQRLIGGTQPFVLDIEADGEWSVELAPVQTGGQPAFSGKGDAVSAIFDPPSSGAWTIFHDGKSNFVVRAHCAGGSQLVENTIGAMDGSAVISFRRGPCLWEVEADGSWRLAPR